MIPLICEIGLSVPKRSKERFNNEKTWKVAVIGCGCFAHAQYFPNITTQTHGVCVAALESEETIPLETDF